MKIKLLGLLLGTMFITNFASAGLLIDPYFGSGATTLEYEIGNLDDDDKDSATVFGSRLGASFALFSVGVDYQVFSGDDKLTTTSAFVGVDLPILLRFWGEYVFSSTLDSEDFDDAGIDLTLKDGYSLGVGFTGLPLVSLNLELQTINFDMEVASTEGDLTIAATVFTVSFPIDL